MKLRVLKACFVSVSCVMITLSCDVDPDKMSNDNLLFEPLDGDETGITFNNQLKEDSVVNYFTYPYIYMGGGVAVGDVNNDGYQDLYFTGNMVENKLYLNDGDFSFSDISTVSGTSGDDRWMTGVTMVDINADGWLDIYVSVSGKFTTKKNIMYVNQGLNAEGYPTFIDRAEELGIADDGSSTQGTFFDYDNDGDLDLYVTNYPYTSFKTPNPTYQMLMITRDPLKSDNLYQNSGDGKFSVVTEASGILNFGLGLSATAGDFNNDGWQDVYVSNDFATPDFFYFNNGDGTFTDRLRLTTQHTSYFGMGVDAGDFNNDGLLDLIQLDMTPEDNRRNKANMASMNPAGFWEMVGLGFHYQYMQNTFQMNNGLAPDGYPRFSDIARLTGTSSTDWSWAALLADLNNDGWKDIFITNGTRKDINNKDYFKEIDKASPSEKKKFDYLALSKGIPNEKVPNYAFSNNGDLSFDNVSEKWGLDYYGFSNGAVYADLDNDGDLEIISNNIDDEVVIHKNLSRERNIGNYLRLVLEGNNQNPLGLGARIRLQHGDNIQYHEHTMTRGFQSSVEPIVHFGVGDDAIVDELKITWPDGRTNLVEDLQSNQTINISYETSQRPTPTDEDNNSYLFEDVTAELGVDFLHLENPYNDFAKEVLLPHMYSKNGPGIASGDVNGDGMDDFFVGGASGYSGVLFVQTTYGEFIRSEGYSAGPDRQMEDLDAAMLDVEGDGDLDLYVVSGGNEFRPGSQLYVDRLYINQGDGSFVRSGEGLPEISSSGARVRPGDFDGDGDPDLFVGGKTIPASYPLPATSQLLRNDTDPVSGKILFTDVTVELAPDLIEMGMVSDGTWTDFDLDGDPDLVIVGEWMPVTFLENTMNGFTNITDDLGFSKSTGWWYSIESADFDNDGDEDLMVGNLGNNYKYQANSETSFDVYAYDFDGNGDLDIVLSYYYDGNEYPLRGRQCSSEQIPAISMKFPNYNSFAEATIEDVYGERDLESALHYKAWTFATSYIENLGDGQFEIRELPNMAQLSSVNGIVPLDYDSDGNLDVILGGNMYGSEVETTRNDAGYGLFLKGDGAGNFDPIPAGKSGLFLKYDTKNLEMISTKYGKVILIANNQDSLRILAPVKPTAPEQVTYLNEN